MKLARLFGLEDGELGELLPALVVAFACVGANGLSTTAADALFVSAFSIADLSRFYVVSAIVRVATSLAFALLAQRFVGRPLFDPLIVLATGLSLTASAALAGIHSHAVVYLVSIGQLVLPPLLPLIAFNATAGSLDARTARRLLPLIAAASTVGSLAAGGAAGVLSHRAGLGALFLGAALLALAAVAPLHHIARRAASTPQQSLRGRKTKPGLFAALAHAAIDIREVPVVRIVVLVGFGGAILTNFVDFAFKSALKARFDQAEMAAYLGVYNVVANLAILLFQLALTSRIVARFGMRAAISSGPLALGALAPAMALLPPVVTSTVLRLVEFVYRYAIGNSIADLMIVPVPPAVRTRAKLIVKGAASPLGALASGVILSALGAPHRTILMCLIVGVAAMLAWLLRDTRDAYASALASALGRGRAPTDVSPEAVRLYKSETARLLETAVSGGDAVEARRTLDLMSDRFFTASDVAPALASRNEEIRKTAVAKAIRLTRTGDGDALLALIGPHSDDETEALVLAAAIERGASVRPARLERALGRAEAALTNEGAARLWALSLTARATLASDGRSKPSQDIVDASVKQLRKSAIGADSPKRAAAMRALGDLRETRAIREIQIGLGSPDAKVFAEAARAAVLVEAPGAVPGLVANLTAGPRAIAASRALALAGPRAVRELVDALPTTRGEGAVAPTAVASSRTVSGTVRAARVLARIGPEACDQVLPMMGGLGYRARGSVAHAFGAARITPTPAQTKLVETAMGVFVSYGETLVPHLVALGPRASIVALSEHGLLRRELGRRVDGSIDGVLDLASVLRDRPLISRARAALSRAGRDRQNALALLETILPASLGRRVIALADASDGQVDVDTLTAERVPLDGWLEKCRLFDEGELPSTDPMRSVLDKVLVLRNVQLFLSLSAEELYPVAEIAHAEKFEPGDEIVRQGDVAEDLYALVEGTCEAVKDGQVVSTLVAGQAFGELSVLDGEPRGATVRATTQAELLRIPRVEFEALLDESPELAKGVIRALLKYLRKR